MSQSSVTESFAYDSTLGYAFVVVPNPCTPAQRRSGLRQGDFPMSQKRTFKPARIAVVLTGLVLWCTHSASAQTVVFSDDFATSTGATYDTDGAIGSSTAWTLARLGADWGARINGGILDVTNDASATANLDGWAFAYTPMSAFSSPYNTTLASNTGIVTWEHSCPV